ncbi:MAG: TPM domain-containing protein [Flavobacteriales bacterium]|nr:TPM domain-containing protein [Flavobacteriales bacterium]
MKSPIVKLLLFGLFILQVLKVQAFDVPAKPTGATRYINDYANLLSPDEENFLNYKLARYWDSTSTDIVVAIFQTINGEEPFDVGLKIYNTWGIGTAAKDNGVLILIVYENDDPAKRKIWITTGKGAEGFLPDGAAGSIIREVMAPAFKEKMYGKGINDAVDQIIARSKGEYKNTEKVPSNKANILVIILIVIILIYAMRNNSGPGSRTYKKGGLLGPATWGGFGGGFHGGGGGGGFSGGFGGGISGGGGAGGNW